MHDQKQAQKVYEVFPVLGTMHDGKDYPDKLIITLGIIERLEGKDAADKYLIENIDVPELRIIAVENALTKKQYTLVEKLCIEALRENPRCFNKTALLGLTILRDCMPKLPMKRSLQKWFASYFCIGILHILKN